MSQVQQFYAGKKVFITGGTGFLGIVLTEKLLRSCPDIEAIFLLIRQKKGKNIQERIDALLANEVFDVLRNERPDFAQKIVAVSGDISEEGLGLTATDHARIIKEVSVIFHLAATVRFDAKLEVAVAMNVNSVKCIIDIAEECKRLEAAIYVSTAYSNCPRRKINEELYPPPLSWEEVNQVVDDLKEKKWSDEKISRFTEGVVKDWPNTYSFTKAIAEGVVARFAKELQFAIFRPSIVICAYAEPMPGWVATPLGLPGLCLGCGLGLVHACQSDDDATADLVPVDYACNALITCAWETGMTRRRPYEDVPVYNYVSGSENRITWGSFFERAKSFYRIYPLYSAIYHACLISTRSRRIFTVLEFLLHLIPALIVDGIAKLFGKQPNLYKIQRKVGVAARALSYFSTQQWTFENERVQHLWQKLGAEDKLLFPFSIQSIDWDQQVIRMVRGFRKYLMRESEDTLPQARWRRLYLYIIHVIVRLIVVLLVAWAIWKLSSGVGSTPIAQSLAEPQRPTSA